MRGLGGLVWNGDIMLQDDPLLLKLLWHSQTGSPPRNDVPTSQLRCKGPPRLKPGHPLVVGQVAPITRGLQGPGNPAGLWAGLPLPSYPGQGHSLPTWRWGPGWIHLSSLYLGSNYHSGWPLPRSAPMDGNQTRANRAWPTGLGGSSSTAGAWEGGGGTNSDFQQSMGEASRDEGHGP